MGSIYVRNMAYVKIGEELEERRGDEEVMGQEPRTAEEMVSIVGEGRAEGQENIVSDLYLLTRIE